MPDISLYSVAPSGLKLAGAALNQTPLDWDGNQRRIIAAIQQAKEAGVDLLCLPELCLTGYGCEDVFLSDWIYAQSQTALLAILPHTDGIAVAIGLPVMVADKRYNGAALLSDGALLGIALKHHLAGTGVYYEPRWFKSWPLGQVSSLTWAGYTFPVGHCVFEVKGHQVAFEICEDAWAADARMAYHYQGRADVILNPSASHFTFGKESLRHSLAESGSRIIGGAYVYVNLLGNEAGRLVFDGDIVVYRNGSLVAEAEPFMWGEYHLLAEDQSERPPALLPPEAEYELSCTLGLYDYMRKSRSKGFCLSLSGGADSACCAVLVYRMALRLQSAYQQNTADIELQLAYWPEVLQLLRAGYEPALCKLLLACLYQGTDNSSERTLAAAQAVADGVGATFQAVDVSSMVAGYTQEAQALIGRPLSWATDDLALQNIQARVRAPMIWLWTNLRGALLLTTSNRSEGSVGYSTMDGDMAGGLAPIAGVSKDFVRRWLHYAESTWGYAWLGLVNHLAPTAELRPLEANQTDEADLMPYALLDQIEHLLVAQKLPEAAALKALVEQNQYPADYLATQVRRFCQLWQRNQWKRERLAPSFHLDAYSVDPKAWCRYPILSGS